MGTTGGGTIHLCHLLEPGSCSLQMWVLRTELPAPEAQGPLASPSPWSCLVSSAALWPLFTLCVQTSSRWKALPGPQPLGGYC